MMLVVEAELGTWGELGSGHLYRSNVYQILRARVNGRSSHFLLVDRYRGSQRRL